MYTVDPSGGEPSGHGVCDAALARQNAHILHEATLYSCDLNVNYIIVIPTFII